MKNARICLRVELKMLVIPVRNHKLCVCRNHRYSTKVVHRIAILLSRRGEIGHPKQRKMAET